MMSPSIQTSRKFNTKLSEKESKLAFRVAKIWIDRGRNAVERKITTVEKLLIRGRDELSIQH